MGHLDKRLDPDKQTGTDDGSRVKDGVSGNVNESAKYEENRRKELPDGAAPDVPAKTGRGGPSPKP